MNINETVKIMRKGGEFHDYEDYLVYGNPVNPKAVIFFEKGVALEKAIMTVKNSSDFLFISGLGVPSEKCLNFIKKLKPKKFVYFGDMDSVSFFTYMAFLYCRREPTPNNKTKLRIEYGGITLYDYGKYLAGKNAEIKISSEELAVLDFVKKFKFPQLEKELKFIEKKSVKVEMEAISLIGFEKYFRDKLNSRK